MKIGPENPPRTFDEARVILLSKLDEFYQQVRACLADPTVTNESYKPFKEACDGLKGVAERVLRLNDMALSLGGKS